MEIIARNDSVRRFWPLGVILVGIVLVIAGFIYDVLFAGIPYPDPTPELAARYAYHASIAAAIRWCGGAIFLAGLFARLIRKITRGSHDSLEDSKSLRD